MSFKEARIKKLKNTLLLRLSLHLLNIYSKPVEKYLKTVVSSCKRLGIHCLAILKEAYQNQRCFMIRDEHFAEILNLIGKSGALPSLSSELKDFVDDMVLDLCSLRAFVTVHTDSGPDTRPVTKHDSISDLLGYGTGRVCTDVLEFALEKLQHTPKEGPAPKLVMQALLVAFQDRFCPLECRCVETFCRVLQGGGFSTDQLLMMFIGITNDPNVLYKRRFRQASMPVYTLLELLNLRMSPEEKVILHSKTLVDWLIGTLGTWELGRKYTWTEPPYDKESILADFKQAYAKFMNSIEYDETYKRDQFRNGVLRRLLYIYFSKWDPAFKEEMNKVVT